VRIFGLCDVRQLGLPAERVLHGVSCLFFMTIPPNSSPDFSTSLVSARSLV
jgi:hypothetical protein